MFPDLRPATFLLLAVAFLLSAPALGQFVVTNAAGDIGIPAVADDVSLCTDTDARLSFRLTASPGTPNPEISITLVDQVTYIDGTVRLVSTNITPAPTISENIGTPQQPRFQITGDFNGGDYVVVSLERTASCDAIDGGGNQDEIFLQPGNTSLGLSTNYDIRAANITVVGSAPVTTHVGAVETVTGTITNGGNGCVSNVDFVVSDAPGIETVSLNVNGVIVTPDGSSGQTTFYTITSDVIQGDGLLCGGESLPFTRVVNVLSCEMDGDEYRALYGCNFQICGFSSAAPQQFNIDFTIPEVTYTGGRVPQPTNFCDTIIVEHDFMNEGDGAAFDVSYLAGFGASGNVLAGSTADARRRFPVVKATVNGVEVPFTIGTQVGLTIDLNDLIADPDGGAGLADLDGDGAFDDLPAGEGMRVRLFMVYECVETCASNRSTGTYKATIDYTDQCGTPIPQVIRPVAGSLANFPVDGRGSVIGPSDVVNGQTIDLQVCVTRRFSGNMVSCSENSLSFQADIPTGFTLETGSTTLNGRPISEAGQVMDSIFIIGDYLGSNIEHCFGFSLTLDCDFNEGDTDFDFNLKYQCDAACDCVETWGCPDYQPIIHCPSPCPQGGLTTLSTRARRSTLGFSDPSGAARANAEDLPELNLKRAMPCDTVCIFAEAVQIDGLSGPTWDNGFFHLEYQVSQANRRTLTYGGGEVYVYDASTMQWDTCPIPPPITDVIVAGIHEMDLDLSACAPNGIFEPGDSVFVNLKTVVEKVRGLNPDIAVQIPQTELYHYNLKDTIPLDGTLDETRCDRWGLELYLHAPTFGNGGGLVRQSPVGCTTYSVNRTFPFSGGPTDLYPGEVRTYYYPDSILIRSTSFDSLDFSSVILEAEGAAADGYMVSFPLGVPDIIRGAPGDQTYVWINDGDFPYGDTNSPFNGASGYSVKADFTTTCASQTGTLTIRYYAQQYAYSANEDCYEPAITGGTVPIIPTPSRTTLSDRTGLVEVSNDTVRWTIQIQNPTQAPANFVFLGFEDGNGSNINVLSVRQIGADTLLTLMDYPLGKWARAADGPVTATAIAYEVTALLNTCAAVPLPVVSGFDCVGYPTDPTTYPCDLNRVTLRASALRSRVQIQLDEEQGPYDLCATIQDTVIVTSAERAFIDSVVLRIPLPQGLTAAGPEALVTYPRGSGNTEPVPINLSPNEDTLIIRLADHSVIGRRGIAGTDDALTQSGREATVLLPFVTDCDFFGNSNYPVIVNARRPCGEPAIGDGTRTVSDQVIIVGTLPTFIGSIEADVIADETAGCETTLVDVNIFNDAGMTDDQDSIFVTLPTGLRYVGADVICGAADPDLCPTLSFVEEDLDQVLAFKIAPGIEGPQAISFQIPVELAPTGGCGLINEVNVRVVTNRTDIICVGSNMNCEAFRVIITEATDTTAFVKNEPALTDFEACTQAGEYVVTGSIEGLTVAVLEGRGFTLRYVCAADPSQTLATQTLAGPFPAGASVAVENRLASSCGGDVRVILDPVDDNCICAATMLDFAPTPEEAITLGEDLTICSTDSITLSEIVNLAEVNEGAIWATDGDGEFLPDATLANARTYLPGPGDATSGRVTLSLTSLPDLSCEVVRDEIEVEVLRVDCGAFPWGGQ